MSERLRGHEAEWWRYDRYEFRNGRICPATNWETGEYYDPWQMYERSKVETRGASPYTELMTLLSYLGLCPPDNYEGIMNFFPHEENITSGSLTAEQIHAVLDWCGRWGLLGLLSHKAVRIELAHELRGPDAGVPYAAYDPDFVGQQRNGFEQTSYVRANGRWSRHIAPWLNTGPGSERHASEPGVTMTWQDEGSNPLEVHDLEVRIWPYFPSVPPDRARSYQYPEPLSDEFWGDYAEPLTEFLVFAQRLALGVRQLSAKFLIENARRERRGLEFHHLPEWDLEMMIAPAAQALYLTDDQSKVEVRWRHPSLLSCFAQMAIQDVLGGTRVEICTGCQGVFTTTSYQAMYCSEKCAWRDRKKRARAERKEKTHGEETR